MKNKLQEAKMKSKKGKFKTKREENQKGNAKKKTQQGWVPNEIQRNDWKGVLERQRRKKGGYQRKSTRYGH